MATSIFNSPGLKSLLLMHKAMLATQVIFALVAFYLVYTNSFTAAFRYLDHPLQVAALAFSAGGFYLGTTLFKKKLLKAREMETGAKEKFASYRRACIFQWSLIHWPSLFAITCFVLTANYAFLALAIVMILLFAMMAPSRLKIVLQLKLSEAEIAML